MTTSDLDSLLHGFYCNYTKIIQTIYLPRRDYIIFAAEMLRYLTYAPTPTTTLPESIIYNVSFGSYRIEPSDISFGAILHCEDGTIVKVERQDDSSY